MPSRYKQMAPVAVVAALLLLPVFAGVTVAQRWPHPGDAYYQTISQLIATLFIAIVLEFLGRDATTWDDRLDRFMVLGLIALSWTGLFASLRAILFEGTQWTSGIAAAGLMSASTLVSLALFRRLQLSSSGAHPAIIFVFLVPPVLLLVF